MEINEPKLIAEHIKLLRTGVVAHSFRRLSEVICDLYPEFVKSRHEDTLRGVQMHGEELCRWACDFLGEPYDDKWN